MTEQAARLQSVTKSYDEAPILRDLNLSVNVGERLVLFGANGSGKTTLVKMLATLIKPTSGFIEIDGMELPKHGVRVRQNIGVLTHQYLLYDDLTGYENLRFFGKMFRVDHLTERIMYLAEMIGISDKLHVRTRTLSHGMQKRFSLARALIHSPSILIMDEPETGLDQEAIEILVNIVKSVKSSLIMTTHNVEFGFRLADRVGIISGGSIAYQERRDALDVQEFKKILTQHSV
jgi:heme exporter protein A